MCNPSIMCIRTCASLSTHNPNLEPINPSPKADQPINRSRPDKRLFVVYPTRVDDTRKAEKACKALIHSMDLVCELS